jgi:hypothetical protein
LTAVEKGLAWKSSLDNAHRCARSLDTAAELVCELPSSKETVAVSVKIEEAIMWLEAYIRRNDF